MFSKISVPNLQRGNPEFVIPCYSGYVLQQKVKSYITDRRMINPTHVYNYKLLAFNTYLISRNSSVRTVTGNGLYGKDFFFFTIASKPALRANQASYPKDTEGLSKGVK
jgi:hypothetical protein